MNGWSWSLCCVYLLLLGVYEGESVFGYGNYYGGRGYYGGGYGGRGYYGGGYYGRGYYRGGIGRRIVGGALVGAAAVGGAALAAGAISRFAGKRKRSAEDIPGEVDYINQAMEYLNLAKQFDEDGCLERTLCEIMATEEDEMSVPLLKLFDLFFDGKLPLFENPQFADGYIFLEAGLLGKQTKSKKACETAYKSCDKDTKIIRQQFKESYAMIQKYGRL